MHGGVCITHCSCSHGMRHAFACALVVGCVTRWCVVFAPFVHMRVHTGASPKASSAYSYSMQARQERCVAAVGPLWVSDMQNCPPC